MGNMQLYHGEALATMDMIIAKGVIVDAIITDPPYRVISGAKLKK